MLEKAPHTGQGSDLPTPINEPMLLAGLAEFFGYNRDYDDPRDVVRRVYVAMSTKAQSLAPKL